MQKISCRDNPEEVYKSVLELKETNYFILAKSFLDNFDSLTRENYKNIFKLNNADVIYIYDEIPSYGTHYTYTFYFKHDIFSNGEIILDINKVSKKVDNIILGLEPVDNGVDGNSRVRLAKSYYTQINLLLDKLKEKNRDRVYVDRRANMLNGLLNLGNSIRCAKRRSLIVGNKNVNALLYNYVKTTRKVRVSIWCENKAKTS